MLKSGFMFLLMMLSVIAQSRADDQIHLEFNASTQMRVPTPVKIKTIIDATTLLGENGQVYSLTGLDIPDDNDTAVKTRTRLSDLAMGKKCTLVQTRNEKVGRVNRMNQLLGHFMCGKDDVWLQGTLLSEGLARVRTTPENNELATKMLILEMKARVKKTGLWALPMNAPLTPDTAARRINSFALVEGKIYSTSQNKESIFLNFTSDWKTDFSIGIPAKLRREFSRQRIDPMSLKGETIRVRGWVRDYNGPYIELDHPAQLEIVGENKKSVSDLPDLLPSKTAQEKEFMHSIGNMTKPDDNKPADIKKPDVESPQPPVISRPVSNNP